MTRLTCQFCLEEAWDILHEHQAWCIFCTNKHCILNKLEFNHDFSYLTNLDKYEAVKAWNSYIMKVFL